MATKKTAAASTAPKTPKAPKAPKAEFNGTALSKLDIKAFRNADCIEVSFYGNDDADVILSKYGSAGKVSKNDPWSQPTEPVTLTRTLKVVSSTTVSSGRPVDQGGAIAINAPALDLFAAQALKALHVKRQVKLLTITDTPSGRATFLVVSTFKGEQRFLLAIRSTES